MAAELEVGIGVDLRELVDGFKKATSQMETFGKKMSDIGGKMSLAITTPLLLVSRQMIKLASDTVEATNKVEVAFGKSGDAVKEFASTSLTQFGIAKGSAMDMAATYGDMSTSMGLTQQQAAGLSITLVGLAADLASFKNIGIDQANTALKGIFTGETESLKTLGIVMTEANLKAYALSKGFKGNTEDLTQSEKVLLRYNYVLENTKNSQGDFARTGGGAANQMRIFSESLKELGDTFGSEILPLFTKAITFVNGLLKEFAKLDSETKTTILTIGGIAIVIGPILAITGKVMELAKYLKYLVTPVGLFGVAMAATAYYVIKEWDKVRGFFYDLEVSFFKFKQNLGSGLFAMGLIDAETAFGDFAEGFSKISRWSETSTDGIKKFTDTIKNGFTNVKGLLDFTGNTGEGKGKLGKIKDEADELDLALKNLDLKNSIANIQGYWEDINRIRASIFEGADIASITPTMSRSEDAAKKDKDLINQLFGGDLSQSTANLQSKLDALQSNIQPVIVNFTEKLGKFISKNFESISSAMSMGVEFLGNALATGLASIFNKDIKFDFKKMLGQFLSALGDMFLKMATPLIVGGLLMNIGLPGSGAAQLGSGLKLGALGVGLKAGGMALASNSAGSTMGNTTTNARNTSPFQGGVGFNGGTVNFEIQGTKLVGVLNNTNQSYGG